MNKEATKTKTTSDREFAVILEKMHSEFEIFGEGLNAVRSKVDATFDQVGRLSEDMFVVKTKVNKISNDMEIVKKDTTEIKDTLKNHDNRITHLEVVK